MDSYTELNHFMSRASKATYTSGGGMVAERMDENFALETFSFLKKAFIMGDKENTFQPRGPADFNDNDWQYHCKLNGDTTKFSGHEFISLKQETVFTHEFFGGIVVDKN